MFPPTQTFSDPNFALRAIYVSVVEVVLPSEPVIPTIFPGHSSKKSSISEVISIPLRSASSRCGSSGLRLGVRKTTSPSRSSRYPSPQITSPHFADTFFASSESFSIYASFSFLATFKDCCFAKSVVFDDSIEYGEKIEKLIKEIHEEK